MSTAHLYSIAEDELPSVNEPTAIYGYVSVHDIDSSYVQKLNNLIGLGDEILAGWLNITSRTLRNYKEKKSKLKGITQEQLVTLLSLYKHGISVFDNKEAFEAWLSTDNPFLDNKAPKVFMDTISGIQLIDNRLTAMEYGENV